MNTPHKEHRKENAPNEHIWTRLALRIAVWKRGMADRLGRQSEKLSTKQKKFALLCFGILMGAVSLALIIEPFLGKPATGSRFMPETFSPAVIAVPEPGSKTFLSKQDYELLIHYRNALDSLKRNNPASYDHLMKDRSGLLDSINFLISIYR